MKKKRYFIFFILFFIAFSILGWFLADNIIHLILSSIPSEIKILALNPIEVFTTVFNIAFIFALITMFPIVIFAIILYVKPALKKNERKIMYKVLSIGTLLFLFGTILSFYGFVTLGLQWFASFNVAYGFETLWSLQQTINTILILSIVSGIIFEFPLVVYHLLKYNLLEFTLTTKTRAIMLVILLVVIGLITPDGSLFTQLFLSIPIYFLIELSIFLGNKNKIKEVIQC